MVSKKKDAAKYFLIRIQFNSFVINIYIYYSKGIFFIEFGYIIVNYFNNIINILIFYCNLIIIIKFYNKMSIKNNKTFLMGKLYKYY